MHSKAELEGISEEKKAIFLTDYGDILIGWYVGQDRGLRRGKVVNIRLEDGNDRYLESVPYIDLKGWGYLE